MIAGHGGLSLRSVLVVVTALQVSIGACGEDSAPASGDARSQLRAPDARARERSDLGTLLNARDATRRHLDDTGPYGDGHPPGDAPSAGDSGRRPPLAVKTGNQVCGQLLACSRACGRNQACVGRCVEAGTKEAQQLFMEADKCLKAAFKQSCKTDCASGPGGECDRCLRQACGKQLEGCAPK